VPETLQIESGEWSLFSSELVLLRPEVLWLAPALILLTTLSAIRLRSLAPWRRRFSVVLQSLSAILLVVALAEPALSRPNNSLYLVVVLDSSASLSEESRAEAATYAQAVLAAADPSSTVNFVSAAGEATVLTSEEVSSGSWLTATGATESAGTDLASGLRLAGTLMGDAGRRRVVLLTDGWETQGGAAAEGERLRARGIGVEVVPLVALGNNEVIVRQVNTAPYLRVGDPLHADVSVYSSVATSATLRLQIDDGPPVERQVSLKAGENNLPVEARATSEGFHRLQVTVEAGADSTATNNTGHSSVVIKPQPSLLLLEDRAGEASTLAAALRQTGMIVTVGTSSNIPARVDQLAQYDSIFLYNMAATSFTLDQQRTLREWVRRWGRGLITSGGGTSYALGGYADSVFEEMLPVSSQPPPRPEQGETALILVMDRSASMDEFRGQPGVISKFDMALEAVRLAVDSVRPGDTVGILSFDTDLQWVARPQVVNGDSDKEMLKGLVSNIELGGGTSIYPALEDAAKAIRDIPTNSKHIVLLTDGREYHVPDYTSLISEMRADNVTLSCIAIGSDSDRDLLTRLARLGQGRYYFTERPENIPKIVFKELDLALREALLEGAVQPHVRAASPILRGYAPQDLPQLGGYSITTSKDEATLALVSDEGYPLLAHWNYGLGRVVSFTSDAGPKWAERWVTWERFSDFWNGAVRWTMASPVNRELQPSVEVREGVAHVTVESLTPEGAFADLQDMSAGVRTPSGVVTTTRLMQSAPGRYEAQVPLGEGGSFEVRVTREGEYPANESAGFSVPTAPELLSAGTNSRLLARITGDAPPLAVSLPEAALRRDGLQSVANSYDPAWQPFLAAGLVLLLASVAVRRLAFRFRSQ
jgi:Ca-activated chloride channel homolog